MTLPRLRHLLFDLGGTLMHAHSEWGPIHERADKALVRNLHEHKIALDSRVFRKQLHEYYSQRDHDLVETTYHLVLRELLNELGHGEVPESVLRSALDALYSVTQPNWVLEVDTLATLQQLQSEDFHLGILSNAGDDKDVKELIEGFGIRQLFDFVLTSAACYYRKPHPRSFELALAQWNIAPAEAVMIGDSLEADILGAQNIGMLAVWITRRAEFTEEDLQRIKPNFSVRKLSELLPTLERISIGRV